MLLEEVSANLFALPSSTPAAVPYLNLVASTQVCLVVKCHCARLENCLPTEIPGQADRKHAKNNFRPEKRKFKRVSSAQENEFALKKILKECKLRLHLTPLTSPAPSGEVTALCTAYAQTGVTRSFVVRSSIFASV